LNEKKYEYPELKYYIIIMVNAQEWFDRKYSTAESKRAVERIGSKEEFHKRIEDNIISIFGGVGPLTTLLLGIDMKSRTFNEILV
jgi:hypothetical protein